MTEGRPQGGQSAANTGAVRRAVPWMGTALVAVGVLLTGLAAPARALVITGGPVYALPGGGTCTLSGAAASAARIPSGGSASVIDAVWQARTSLGGVFSACSTSQA